jgi:hypothetical protein
MKKVLYVFLGLIALLLIVAIAIPVIYKDEIRAKLDREIAKSVNAEVYYDAQKFNLSLIRNFPNVTVQLGDFGVVGKDEFKGDTLTSVKSFEVVVNLMSVISGDQIKVNRVFLDEPRILAKVLSDGRANWDIVIEDTTAADTTEPSEFSLAVKDWQIQNGYVVYNDNSMPMFARIAGLNHRGSGDFTQDIFDMSTSTTVDALSVEFDSVMYMSNNRLAADMNLNMNMPESKYTFKDNTIRINNFAFGFDGWLAMPDTNNINMDLTYQARETQFKNIFSLVPGVFTEDFDDIQTDGTLAFDGFAKGTYNEATMPAFGLNLKVDNGMFKYPKLPNAVSNIVLDMNVANQKGILDSTVVNIKKFHMDMGKNPVDARALVKGLTNYDIDANVVARLNLGELTSAFPLEGTTLRGLFSLNLDAKGVYSDSLKLLPAIKANMSLIDGYAKTADFPSAIENINFNASVTNETGQMKDARIQMPNFSMTMDGEPFEAVAYVENLDDYIYDVKLKGIIDLAKMTKIYPLEDMTVTGRVAADIQTKGRMSDVEAERYDRLPTSGTMKVTDLTYVSPDMPQGVRITNADMNFNPRNIQLASYEGFLGKSPVSMTGSISNYIGYMFKEGQIIKGNLNFNSPRFDVNEWMTEDTAATTEEPTGVFEVPKDVDFVLASNITEVLYDNMVLNNLKGNIILKEGIARMDKLNFNTLGGSIAMDGLYDSRNLSDPKFDFDLNMQSLAISEAYKTFNTIQALAPIAQKMDGTFSTDFKLSGSLKQDMTPVYNTLTGGGIIKVAQASVNNLDVLGKINSLVKTNMPTDLQLKDILIKAQVIDGKAIFEPFDVNLGNNKMTIGGSNSFDGGIDYLTKLTVPAGAVGEAFNNALANLTGSAPTGGQNINLNLGIGGTYSDPKVNLLGSSAAGGAKATAKEAVKEAVQTRVDDAKERVQAKVDSARQEAEARARAEAERAKQEAEAKAREEADRLKKEAENKARQEAEKLKKKLGFPK